MTSSSRMTTSSSPSTLTSVPEYLPKRILSPALTSGARNSPLSKILPLPTAMTLPKVGFSVAVSGITMPPGDLRSSASRLTMSRSCNGRISIEPPFWLAVSRTGNFGNACLRVDLGDSRADPPDLHLVRLTLRFTGIDGYSLRAFDGVRTLGYCHRQDAILESGVHGALFDIPI